MQRIARQNDFRHGLGLLGGLLIFLSPFVTPSAFADGAEACPYPASDAKELAAHGLVRAARTKLSSCIDACDDEERASCRAALDALHVPTIVVTVTDSDPASTLRTDVRVVVDGEAAKPNVPIEVDPGTHLVQVQGTRVGAERKLVVSEGATDLPVAFATPKNAVEVEAEQGGQARGPWVLMALGFTGITFGMILTIVAEVRASADPQSGSYDRLPDPTVRGIGIAYAIGGIAFVGTGIMLHFLDTSGTATRKKAALAPMVSPSSFGLSLSGTF